MKILLAVDDSTFSQAATDALIAQARPNETEVQVLNVIEPLPLTWETGYDVLKSQQKEEAESLVAHTAKVLRDAGFQVTTTIETGSAKSLIVDTAARWPADLIIVGAHGRKGLDRFLLGSVSEAVTHHAACSVQVVRTRKA
jgi:nucleotide-binding universal stress UspA family protein